LVLHKSPSDGALTPILIPTYHELPSSEGSLQQEDISATKNTIYKSSRSCHVLCFLFTFKGSLHLLLISAFETLFYFLYVNESENQGIQKTIDTYYQPLVQNCNSSWNPEFRWIIQEVLEKAVNLTQVDQAGFHAAKERSDYNRKLLIWSCIYSVICFTLCLAATLYVKWKRWIVPWKRMIAENLSFVLILAIYEVFFFRTIVYEYKTLSTSELNQYIIDGLASCSLQSSLTNNF
jgi:hypothetical protein